jgi:hypothetical protein
MRTQPFCLPQVGIQQILGHTGAKGGFGGTKRHLSNIRLVFRPAFRRPSRELPGNAEDPRRRRLQSNRGRKPFLGGSDPTLSGLGAAQRHGRRGSLPPMLSSRPPRSVADRVVEEAVRNSESHQQ